MKRILYALVILAVALPLAAQQKPAQPAPQPAAADPQLSEILQLKVENATLRYQALQQQFDSSPQVQQVRAQYSAVMQEIEKAYPGYQYDPRQNRLVKLPPQQPPVKAPATKTK